MRAKQLAGTSFFPLLPFLSLFGVSLLATSRRGCGCDAGPGVELQHVDYADAFAQPSRRRRPRARNDFKSASRKQPTFDCGVQCRWGHATGGGRGIIWSYEGGGYGTCDGVEFRV